MCKVADALLSGQYSRQPWFFSLMSRRASPCPACKKSVDAGVGPVVFLNFFSGNTEIRV